MTLYNLDITYFTTDGKNTLIKESSMFTSKKSAMEYVEFLKDSWTKDSWKELFDVWINKMTSNDCGWIVPADGKTTRVYYAYER